MAFSRAARGRVGIGARRARRRGSGGERGARGPFGGTRRVRGGRGGHSTRRGDGPKSGGGVFRARETVRRARTRRVGTAGVESARADAAEAGDGDAHETSGHHGGATRGGESSSRASSFANRDRRTSRRTTPRRGRTTRTGKDGARRARATLASFPRKEPSRRHGLAARLQRVERDYARMVFYSLTRRAFRGFEERLKSAVETASAAEGCAEALQEELEEFQCTAAARRTP